MWKEIALVVSGVICGGVGTLVIVYFHEAVVEINRGLNRLHEEVHDLRQTHQKKDTDGIEFRNEVLSKLSDIEFKVTNNHQKSVTTSVYEVVEPPALDNRSV